MESEMMNDFDPFFGQGIDMGLEEDGTNEENVEPALVDEGNMIDDVEVDMTNLKDFDSESDSDFESTRKKKLRELV
ncbi:hypothetical protein L6452_11929 [Arctium lappa]|uniref:Uncharacterized protein n=1 Tax=Arctium lappa TaxID=4217 RepID=A0ACB9DPN8_ARCLA|nr:hypothetical protein L6452_11929 [Arctium lappa]